MAIVFVPKTGDVEISVPFLENSVSFFSRLLEKAKGVGSLRWHAGLRENIKMGGTYLQRWMEM